MTEPVLTERRGLVLVVTLNRPEVRNAVDRSMAQAIAQALDELDESADLAVGVLAGAAGCFSSGMDLKAFVDGGPPFVDGRGFAGIVERPSRKPLVAAIEGFAVAGGFEIALACDIVVAASDAKLGLPEVRRGLVAGSGGLLRLPRRAPYHVALELALTGEAMSAGRLHELGLVNHLTEPGEAVAVAVALAEKIAQNAPLAVQASKQIVQEAFGERYELWRRQDEIAATVFASEDAREGSLAFTEKREPSWQGR